MRSVQLASVYKKKHIQPQVEEPGFEPRELNLRACSHQQEVNLHVDLLEKLEQRVMLREGK